MVREEPFRIGGREVRRGERLRLQIPVAHLYTSASVTMPVQVLRGHEAGPTLFVSAALHGDEIVGVEIVRRLLALPALRRLRGTLLAVPVVNTLAFLQQSRYLPDRRDLNRSFPGREGGSLAARLAHVFIREIVERADYGIDLHTGAIHRPNLPHIRADLANPETLRLAQSFGVPLLLNSPPTAGTLRQYTTERGIPVLLYEAGEALRIDELAIRIGMRGVLKVMVALGMLPRPPREPKLPVPVIAASSSWVRAPAGGILRTQIALGEEVHRGQVLGVIGDPMGGFGEADAVARARAAAAEAEVRVSAPAHGVLVGRSALPLVHEGDALFHIARFDAPETAAGVARSIRDARRAHAARKRRPRKA